MRARGRTQLRVDDAGLHDRHAIGLVDFHDPIEARQDEQHRALACERAARESGARAAGHERHSERGEQSHDRDELFARTGKNDQIGKTAVRGETVHRVCQKFSTSLSNVLLADNGCEIAGQEGRRGHTIY